jgi:hypothetical protein
MSRAHSSNPCGMTEGALQREAPCAPARRRTKVYHNACNSHLRVAEVGAGSSSLHGDVIVDAYVPPSWGRCEEMRCGREWGSVG